MDSIALNSQAIRRTSSLQPSSVGTDPPHELSNGAQLRSLSVPNSEHTLRRASSTSSANFPSTSNPKILLIVSPSEGPRSKLDGKNSSTDQNEDRRENLATPYPVGTVISEGLTTLSGITNVLSAIPPATGTSAADLGNATMITGVTSLGLGTAAGGFAIYQQSKQINLLETQKQQILNSVKPLNSKSEEDNSDGLQPTVPAERQIRRLEDQIQQLKKERIVTAGVVGSSAVLGATTVGLMATGSLMAARNTGTALGGLGIVMSTYGAITDGHAAITQRKVNEQLNSSLKKLETQKPEAGELTASLNQVAKHAKTAGKSRERGKWFSMSMNVLNGLTGAAGIACKFLIVGSAAATAGTVLLAAGGALAVGALFFGAYKLHQHLKLKNAANVALINTQVQPERSIEHEGLLKNNKYYALKQFVADLQSNNSVDQKNTTLDYLSTALNMSLEEVNTFYDELKNPDTSASATQLLANALFRAKPIVM